MRYRAVLTFAFLAATAGAGADEVWLVGGRRLEGVVVARDARSVTLDIGPGRVALPMRSVTRIVDAPSPLAVYRLRAQALAAHDVQGWLSLARWAEAQGLRTQAEEAKARVRSLAPGHPELRQEDLDRQGREAQRAAQDEAERARREREEAEQALAAAARQEAEARAREAESRAREAETRARQAEEELAAPRGPSLAPDVLVGGGFPFGFPAPFPAGCCNDNPHRPRCDRTADDRPRPRRDPPRSTVPVPPPAKPAFASLLGR